MSIIYDALKKTEKNTQQGNPPQAPIGLITAPPSPDIQKQTISSKKLLNNHNLIIFAVGIASIICAWLIVAFLGKMALHPVSKVAPAAQEALPQTPAPQNLSPLLGTSVLTPDAAVTPPQSNPPENVKFGDFTLNGIVTSQEGNIALIDDKTVSVGDVIGNNVKVLEITADQVVLGLDEKKQTLKLK